MNLQERLMQDMKSAMKQKDAVRLTTIRQIRATIKNQEIALQKTLDDDDVLKVIATLVKQHKDSIEQFTQGGRIELAEQEQAELVVLEEYLPQQLGEEELTAIVKETIQEVGATSMKDIGKFMKAIMPKVQGRADGKLINQIARDILTS